MKTFLTLTVSIFLLGIPAYSEVLPDVVSMQVKTAYVPLGFDSNDRVQFVVEGYLPNTCYRVGPHKVSVNPTTNVISFQQYAYQYKGMCLMMTVPFHHVVDVGILKEGQYTIKDINFDSVLGGIPIRIATTVEADDFLYAPVTDANVDTKTLKVTVVGVFANSCIKLKEIKVLRESHNVVTVLPISELKEQKDCKEGNFAFSQTAELPILNDGRYLLHVRSLNGQAITKLFEIGGVEIR